MKLKYLMGTLGIILLSGVISGCIVRTETLVSEQVVMVPEASTKQAAGKSSEAAEKSSEAAEKSSETAEKSSEAVEDDGKYYYMVSENNGYPVPSLRLLDNGRFGFFYDVLSSYYPHGSYEIKDGKLTAITDDGRSLYVFNVDLDGYVFVKAESSKVDLTDARVGTPVTDGARFILGEATQDAVAHMEAVVKEVAEEALLVTSLTDQYPGAYYVYYGERDISFIKGGDKILIGWNGAVQETSPAQIYAETLEKIQE